MERLTPPVGTGKRGRTLDSLLAALQALLLERGAGTLSISDVAERAGVAQGTFYNYASSLDGLIDALATLLSAAVGTLRRDAPSAKTDAVAAFAFKTRQMLSLFVAAPDYGRLLFESGLPVDRFLLGLRKDLEADIRIGAEAGAFKTANPALSASIIAGCLVGVALDLYRSQLSSAVIEETTAEMLVLLGVTREVATRAAVARLRLEAPPALPLRWLALGATERDQP